MNVKDKLDSLRRLVYDEVKEDNAKMTAEIAVDFENRLSVYRKQLEAESDTEFEMQKIKAGQIRDKNVTIAAREANHSLIDLRKQLIEELFESVSRHLSDYVETEEYRRRLIEEIRMLAEEFSGIIIVKLCGRDIDVVRNTLQNKNITLEPAETDILGGFTALIPEKGIQIDSSYNSALIRERESFHAFSIQ